MALSKSESETAYRLRGVRAAIAGPSLDEENAKEHLRCQFREDEIAEELTEGLAALARVLLEARKQSLDRGRMSFLASQF